MDESPVFLASVWALVILICWVIRQKLKTWRR